MCCKKPIALRRLLSRTPDSVLYPAIRLERRASLRHTSQRHPSTQRACTNRGIVLRALFLALREVGTPE